MLCCTHHQPSHTSHGRSYPSPPPKENDGLVQVPLLAVWYQRPCDGLPPLQNWINTASDVLHGGFESAREPIECKLRTHLAAGSPLQLGCLQATKGVGRLAVLYFGVLWTFLNLKVDAMKPEEIEDLQRPAPPHSKP